MIDITEIQILKLYIHRVGNQLRNEGVSGSESAQNLLRDNKLPLTKFLFGQADRLNPFAFTHSVSPELNTISSLATMVSSQPETIKRVSADIANHLYSVSDHPKIKAGNLFVGLFDGVRFEDKRHTVLGVFKSDTLDDFIKVEVNGGRASLKIEQGAAITSLDKVGLIFLPQKGNPKQVLAACSRGEDAVFWNERFLQLVPVGSAKTNTKACLDICRAFATQKDGKPDNSERVLFLNRSLEFFESSERYSDEDFASVFANKAQEEEFQQFKTARAEDTEQSVPKSFVIEKTVVRKERAKFQKNLKLDSNIEIRLRFKNQTEMKKRVEHGYDRERGLAFYKLYYSTEK